MIARYTRPALATLWSEPHKFDTWLRVELAACEAMEEAPDSPIPRGTTAALRERTHRLTPWDVQAIQALEAQTQHDVVAFLRHLEHTLGPEARFLHWGLTSSDMLDTTLALLLREATQLLLEGLHHHLLPALRTKAFEYKQTPLMGRSHGIHAEPITAGLVFASLYAEHARAADRLQTALRHISFGKLSGAVGVYGSGCLSPEVERKALERLNLQPEPISTQIIPRDRHAELFLSIALLGTAIERLALTVRHWQRTEVDEAEEAFGTGQTGSSAMPHKKNPVLSENLCGLARLLRAEASASLENVALWHERDISHSSVERIIAPQLTTLADFMIHRAASLVSRLRIKPEHMQRNHEHNRGLHASEKVLLALVGKGISRELAYRWVQRNAMVTHADKTIPFVEQLQQDPDITNTLSAKELQACFDENVHLRHVDALFARVFSPKASVG